ncbi:Uncharacterized protein RNJ44_03110 [Nakaseomyces bracarensis]|uniref:Uncharacterized protein n=1 Tax=Nakaseomyces bracarensis TaxID=273131 RepID=A0ABR4NYR8_9SACH
MFSQFTKFVEYVNSLNADYNALSYDEQKAMSIMERLQTYNWTFEACTVAILVFIVVFYKVGTSVNCSKAKKVMTSVNAFLNNELCFAKVGLASADQPGQLYTSGRGNTWFSTFATGRSNIASVIVNMHLAPLNNPMSLLIEGIIAYLFPSLKTQELEDFVEVTIKPNGIYLGTEAAELTNDKLKARKDILTKFKFITAIVNKSVMNEVHDEHYYLSLCGTSEHNSLPLEYVYMSEMNQLNGYAANYLSNSRTPLKEVLKESTGILKFMAFTDLPSEKPYNEKEWNTVTDDARIVIRTSVPKNSTDLEALNKLISIAVEVYDGYTAELNSKGFAYITNDMLKKSSNLRNQELQKLIKAAKLQALEDAKEKKLAEEKEKRRQMKGTLEQQKMDQKMKEKRERRQKNKMKVKM